MPPVLLRRPFAPLRLNTRVRRRAAVLALWAAFAAHVAAGALGGDGELVAFASTGTLLLGIVSLFSLAEASALRGGSTPLDAGRLAARDRAYAAAFHGTAWLLLSVVLYAELALRGDGLWLPDDPRAAFGLLAAAGVAVALLPVSLIAWMEPEDPPSAPPQQTASLRGPRRYAATLDDRERPRWLH